MKTLSLWQNHPKTLYINIIMLLIQFQHMNVMEHIKTKQQNLLFGEI
jgi:hypothetical protein